MRLLLIHSNKLEYEITKKALKDVEIPEDKEGKIGECLVVFWTAEKRDENVEKITENSFKEIKGIAEQIKEKKIVLYPYIHLLFESKPASKEIALEIERKLEEKLKKEFKDLPIRLRKTGEIKKMKIQELIRFVKNKTEGMPYKPLPIKREISKQIKFVG